MNEDLMNKVLKSLLDGRQPSQNEYDVDKETWDRTASYLKNEGYIRNITLSNNTQYMFAELTEKGREYAKGL